MRPTRGHPGLAKCHLPVLQAPEPYEVRRSRRKRSVRASSINVGRITKRELELGRVLYPDHGERLPATRAECAGSTRPCPFVSCQHHLYLDVNPKNGNIKFNFPDLEPDELIDSCALDAAERGGMTTEAVGGLMNITRERVKQIELVAKEKIAPEARRLL